MTLQQLKYVVTVADKGTISDAAKELFISQPTGNKFHRSNATKIHYDIW